jgi:beta-lactamase class D
VRGGFPLLLAALVVAACAGEPPTTDSLPYLPGVPWQEIDLSGAFEAFDAAGVVLLREGSGPVRVHGASRAGDRFPPASTFKLPHALLALELGVVADEHEVIAWDGTDHGGPGWNRDHDLASALQVSAVWYFQEMARRIGRDRMNAGLERLGYGNRSIDGALDRFWLDGGLRISPAEQLVFLERLEAGNLPVRPEVQATVRRIMAHDLPDGRPVLGKTGWTIVDGRHHGWYVGWTGPAFRPRFFVVYVTSTDPDFPMRRARLEILSHVLAQAESGDAPVRRRTP